MAAESTNDDPLGPLAQHIAQVARLADRMLDAWEAVRLLAHRLLDDARNGGPDAN